MNETNASWDDLHLFVAIAREGGLSPASRVTGRSAATLGRRMRALERAMGQELFTRHDRGYTLTTQGRSLMEGLSEIETRIMRLTEAPRPQNRPLVKISAGTWTTLALLDRLDQIIGTPADIRPRFVSAETVLDLARREVLIGFRNRRPTEDGLAGRKLLRVEFAPYARRGDPVAQRWIKVLADTPSARWLDKTVGSDALCEVTTPRNSLDLALSGHGIALLPTFIGARHDGLTRVGDTVPELAHDQWIVTHNDDRHLPEVRRTIDRLTEALSGDYP